MDIPYFRCEDCGHEFAKTGFMPDVEDDDIVECPVCGGLDIQLVDRRFRTGRRHVARLPVMYASPLSCRRRG